VDGYVRPLKQDLHVTDLKIEILPHNKHSVPHYKNNAVKINIRGFLTFKQTHEYTVWENEVFQC